VRRSKLLLLAASFVATAALVGSAAGARSPHEPTYRPVPADVKVAKSLLLRAHDLTSGFRAAPPTDEYFRCTSYDPDLSHLVTTGEGVGRAYERNTALAHLGIQTFSYVFGTTKEANSFWRWSFNDRRNGQCLSEVIKHSLEKLPSVQGQKITWTLKKPEIQRLSRAGQRAVFWSVAPVLSVGDISVVMEMSVLGFISGRSTVFAVLTSVGDSKSGTVVEKILVTLTDRLDAVTPSRAKPLSAG
jgi:hypothetical protein